MAAGMNTIRLLGAAQLLVFAASMVSERLLALVVASGTISAILVNISRNATRLRISNLFADRTGPGGTVHDGQHASNDIGSSPCSV